MTITDDVFPPTVTAYPGDEIRCINMRREPVQLDLPMLGIRDLACRRNFSNWMVQLRESITLQRNGILCFPNPTVLKYLVRAETSLPGGRDIMSGSVNIVR